MTETGGLEGLPSALRRRLPISLDGVVAQDPVFVNHGANYQQWRLETLDGTSVGQVRVYVGRQDERGKREAVYIPPRGEVEHAAFSLPHAETFSEYLRDNLAAYLQAQGETAPIDTVLRRGPTIVGVIGEGPYFLRWNVYFKDEKIGEYTVHDMNPDRKTEATAHEGERTYKGRIPGYVNASVVAWNEFQDSSKDPHLLAEDGVSLCWARLLALESPKNRYQLVWKRGDFLDISFP